MIVNYPLSQKFNVTIAHNNHNECVEQWGDMDDLKIFSLQVFGVQGSMDVC